MKKILTSLIAIALLGCASMSAATPEIKSLGEAKYSIAVGDVTMTINANEGAKILSFKYKDAEVISQMKRFNAYGSTFWTSPQAEWNWPPVAEYDRLPYEVEQTETSLIMTSKTSERFQYSIRKEFTADPSDNSISVTYSIINHSDNERQVAPWEITRVPGDGLIFFACPSKNITPADKMNFVDKYGAAWYAYDESKEQRKINADGKGWLAYANNGLLLVKKFPNLLPSQPAPKEAEIQVYVNEGKTFIELESQGAYTTLQPGGSLSYTVKWYLLPADNAGVPSKKLIKAVKQLVK